MKVLIIRTSGSEEVYACDSGKVVNFARNKIGADAIDTVSLRDGRIMLFDDNGYECRPKSIENGIELIPVKANKPVNPKATALYHSVCVPGTTHEIVGDVAIIHER